MQLTQSQKKAIEYTKGPLLIIAGAGTGKTTVLVEKIKYLIKKRGVNPGELLALTFTEKAASEIEERVDKSLPYGYFQMNIGTFHSFCDTLLRQEGIHIGLSAGYKIFSQAQLILFFRQNLFLFDLKYFRPLGNPTKFIEALLTHFHRLHDEDISPTQYLSWAKKIARKTSRVTPLSGGSPEVKEAERIEKEKNLELAHAYKAFQELKAQENILDFSDLIYYALMLLRKRPNVLESIRQKYKHVLIDEFQDTNIAQYELIRLLCPPSTKTPLTMIGDDNQSIYKFRGASISNIMQFMDDYKSAKHVVLTENFRSNQAILDTAYKLIKYNDPDTLEAKLNISKKLRSQRDRGTDTSVQFSLSDRVEKEADYVTTLIEKLKKKYDWRDFAILVRANNHADPFIKSLNYAGISYQILGPGSLFKQPEVKDLIAYLFFINNIGDSSSLFRVLSMDVFLIQPTDLAILMAFTKKTSHTLFEALEIYLALNDPDLTKPEYEKYRKHLSALTIYDLKTLRKIYDIIIKSLTLVKKETGGHIAYRFIEQSGLLAKIITQKSEKEEKIARNITEFFEKLKDFEMSHEDSSLSAICSYISLSLEIGESPIYQTVDKTETNAVNILTVHASKGLEFGVVFMVNLTQDRFPTRERKETIPIPEKLIKETLPEGDYHLEEERRLFYVGTTRARDKLFFCASQYYGEGKRVRKVSPFIYEAIGNEEVEKRLVTKKAEKAQLSIFDPHFISSAFAKKEPINAIDLPKQTKFSYSQLETYKLCPLRYKYQYIFKIPVTTNAAASFGETIHKSFELFYTLHKAGQKPDKEKLIGLYEESWIPIGYTSKAFEIKMKKEGIKLLKNFYDNYHHEHIQILDLERWFKIKLAREVSIVGKIDRIDSIGNGEMQIVDYKTGKKPTLPELKKNLQLGIYALAAQDKGLYNTPVDKVTLTFYFLQHEDAQVSLKKTAAELEEVKKQVLTITDEIRQGVYTAHVGPWCQFCPFKINCEAWQ